MTAAAADETTPAAPKRRSTLSRILRVVGYGLLVAVAGLALIVIFPPEGLVTGQLTKLVREATGRDVSIGAASLRVRDKVEVSLDDVVLANPAGMEGPPLVRAKGVKAKIALRPLFDGKVEVEDVSLDTPEFALHEDAAGKKNWEFGESTGPEGPPLMLPQTTVIHDGRVAYSSARTGAAYGTGEINAKVTRDASGAVNGKGSANVLGDIVSFDATTTDPSTILNDKPTVFKAKVAGRHVTADFDGMASVTEPMEISGNLTAASPSAMALAKWLGAKVEPAGKPLKTSLKGKITATKTAVGFAQTDIDVNGMPGRLDGRLSFDGPRPKLEGTFDTPKIDLAALLGVAPEPAPKRGLAPAAEEAASAPQDSDFEPDVEAPWEGLKAALATLAGRGRAAAAPAPVTAAARAPAKGNWSKEPFDLSRLRTMDLDMVVTTNEVAYKKLDLKKARIKTQLTDGKLSAKLEELGVGAGKATGIIDVDSRASPPKAGVTLNLANVAAEPIITELAGKPLLSGTSNVEIKANAAGQNPDQLASTLEGKARFRMAQGAMRGFDIRRMISEWWKSWKFDLGNKTNFERLEAQYDIKKGIMKSSPGLDIDGREVAINSTGEINVPARRLNQEIKVKVIPPPTALPIPVKISGDWTKPTVAIDWNGLLFSSARDQGGPQAVARALAPLPDDLRQEIEAVLTDEAAQSKVSDQGKLLLEELLEPGQ